MLSLLTLLVAAAAEGAAPPAPPAADDAARPPSQAARSPVAFLVSAGFGGSDQVDGETRWLTRLETGLLFGGGLLRGGVLASVERQGLLAGEGGARTLSASAVAGVAFRAAEPGRIELLGEVGVRRFWLVARQSMASSEQLSGGDATRTFVGARLLWGLGGAGGPRGDLGASLGVFAQFTPGGSPVPYTATICPILSPCTTESREARYRGGAIGLLFTVALGTGAGGASSPPP